MRFQYKTPWLYDLCIKLLYPKELTTKICELVGRNSTVFEPAAGYGRMARIIDKSNNYRGIDLNDIFVRYAKQHNINIKNGNILLKKNYIKSDILLLVDIVHHLTDKQIVTLLDNAFRSARRRVIVVEPAFVHLEDRYGLMGKIIDRLLMWLDSDGTNDIRRWFTPKQYQNMFNTRFKSKYGEHFRLSYQKICNHHVACYSLA